MRNGGASATAWRGRTCCCAAAQRFEIVPEIEVRPEDIVVDKTCNGAFTLHLDFEHVLRAQGITHLLFHRLPHESLASANDAARSTATAISSALSSRTPAPAATSMRMRQRFTW